MAPADIILDKGRTNQITSRTTSVKETRAKKLIKIDKFTTNANRGSDPKEKGIVEYVAKCPKCIFRSAVEGYKLHTKVKLC